MLVYLWQVAALSVYDLLAQPGLALQLSYASRFVPGLRTTLLTKHVTRQVTVHSIVISTPRGLPMLCSCASVPSPRSRLGSLYAPPHEAAHSRGVRGGCWVCGDFWVTYRLSTRCSRASLPSPPRSGHGSLSAPRLRLRSCLPWVDARARCPDGSQGGPSARVPCRLSSLLPRLPLAERIVKP